ncbi:LuxR family transcriptional regulator [Amaricoccus sp.]|uniref:LuxR family transcriptional regulator n=1 Tax=Amaricoccus sp. TaxID=1872485 RepID=UPI00262F5637|nr:LuxR family transcriptional regulator [uncultured Amaricoccus sp.]
MDVHQFERRIETLEEVEPLWQLLVTFARERRGRYLGYQHLAPIGAPDAHVQRVVSAGFSDDWIAFYLAARANGTTPVATHAERHGEPVYWTDIETLKDLTPEEERHLAALRAAGLTDGLCIPVFGPAGRNGLFALTFQPGIARLPPEDLGAIHWACQTAHLRYCALLRPTIGEPPTLSRREAEVLAWVARGKSNACIGAILGISAHTVDAHLRRIYLKMGVFDRISAALRGLGFGLIHSDV